MRFKVFFFTLFIICTGSFSSAEVVSAEGRDAGSIFDSYCFSCHGTGWDNAPVIGDAFAWEDRLAKGLSVLVENTIKGINTMPPKGNCFDCTDAELKAVVEYLVSD